MKLFAPITPIVFAAATAFASGPVHAQDRGWYVRGDLGGTVEGTVDGAKNQDLKDGWIGGAGAGYALGNGLRTEGEVVYLQSDLKRAGGGEAKTLGAFANVTYDFNVKGPVQPFVGAGLGVAHVKVDENAYDDTDTGFAYQAKAGISYKINERLTGELAYRYLRVTDVKFGSGDSRLEGDVDSQAITVGVRYKLGS